MATKTKSPEKDAFYSCSECHNEFTGTACPTCGNKEGNTRLAPDGLAQTDHKKNVLFGNIGNFKSTDDIMNPNTSLADKVAQMDYEQATTNMRDMYVLKTEINKRELELKALQKKREYDEIKNSSGVASSGQNPYGQRQNPAGNSYGMPPDPYQSIIPPFNSQAQLINSLMKMDKDKRAEFLDSLASAQPEALQNLSGMLNPAPQMNLYGNPGYPPNPMINPWMMQNMMLQQAQQHQQPQHQQSDPLELAVSIIQTISELQEKNKPPVDDSMKEMLREMREEVKNLRERVINPPSNNSNNDVVLEKINSLQSQINQSHQPRSISDSITEISTLMDGLQKIGLAQRPDSGKTVDDDLKLKEFEHKVSREDKELALQEKKLVVEEQKSKMGQNLFATMLQKSIARKMKPESQDIKSTSSNAAVHSSFVTERVVTPHNIISEVKSDSGTIREIGPTIIRSNIAGV